MPSSPHDDYIAKSPAFAAPILRRIRGAIHAACPDVVESMKWKNPHFEYEGMLAAMGAYKKHVSFDFWRGREMSDPEGILKRVGATRIGAMRLEKLSDLPPKRVLVRYVKEAMRVNEQAALARKTKSKAGAKKVRKKPKPRIAIDAPADLLAALKKNKRARATFEAFSYTNKKDYVEWITEARHPTTREQRVATAVEWMAEGKPRNWKYMKAWR